MNKDIFQGHWNEFKGKIKEQWGKLTDDEISQINGRWDQFLGKIQTKYGWTKEKAETELTQWYNNLNKSGSENPSREKQHIGAGSFSGQKNASHPSSSQFNQGSPSHGPGQSPKEPKKPSSPTDRPNRDFDKRNPR